MSAIEQLEALTTVEPEQNLVQLGGESFKIPVLKARHLSKVIKLMLPYEVEIIGGDFTVIYRDLDFLLQIVSVFFDKDIEWAGDLTTEDVHKAFATVIEANPNFFVEVVASLMARQ